MQPSSRILRGSSPSNRDKTQMPLHCGDVKLSGSGRTSVFNVTASRTLSGNQANAALPGGNSVPAGTSGGAIDRTSPDPSCLI